MARRLRDGREEKVAAPDLQKGDLVVCEAGEIIPADGDVIEGIASVDESAITGESAPVIRESGGDRSAVTGGTRVLSDRIVIRVTMETGDGFLDRMIALVEGAQRQKTPNEIALTILLAALTFIFLLVCVTLKPFGIYSGRGFFRAGAGRAAGLPDPDDHRRTAERHRHRRHGPRAAAQRAGDERPRRGSGRRRGRAAARQDRHDHARQPHGHGVSSRARHQPERLADAAQLASLADETPEGRSIVVLAKEKFGSARPRDARAARAFHPVHRADAHERRGFSRQRTASRTQRSAKARPKRSAVIVESSRRHVSRRRSAKAVEEHLASRRHAAGRRRRRRSARRRSTQRRGQRRHQGALRPAPQDGHPDGHDHRRQPADRRRHRRRGRRG